MQRNKKCGGPPLNTEGHRIFYDMCSYLTSDQKHVQNETLLTAEHDANNLD